MFDNPNTRFELITKTIVETKKIHWNLTPPLLYEEVIKRGEAMLAENGPLAIYTQMLTQLTPILLQPYQNIY